jgi:hypothetical protein
VARGTASFGFGHALNQRKDRPVRQVVVAIMLAAGPFVVGASLVLADGVGDPTAVKHDDGRYYDKEGNPTFKVQSDGTVDWGTYSVTVPTPKDRATHRRSAIT